MPEIRDEMTAFLGWFFGVLSIIVVISAICWAIIVVPGNQIFFAEHLTGDKMSAKDYLTVENALRQTMAQLFAGLGAFVSIAIAFWGAHTNRRNAKLTEEGQITDRFGKAVEKLASDTLSVRLGGIYALERIARDSERDHWPVMEILTAYVRERGQITTTEDSEPVDTPPAAADIHAVLTVLSRRAWYREEEHEILDLSGVNLSDISLPSGACFRNAKLTHCVIQNANWSGVDLSRADLAGTLIQEVTMQKAFLQDANLDECRIQGVNMVAAKMMHATLNAAKIENTTFVHADLEAASFCRSTILDCDIASARAPHANFMRANMHNVSLCSADLRWAKFDSDKLENVRFDGANRGGIDLIDEAKTSRPQNETTTNDTNLTPELVELLDFEAPAQHEPQAVKINSQNC
jgi:uncharacterized protein YjbI with pentapeptide repeats